MKFIYSLFDKKRNSFEFFLSIFGHREQCESDWKRSEACKIRFRFDLASLGDGAVKFDYFSVLSLRLHYAALRNSLLCFR